MKLAELHVNGYKCFREPTVVPMRNLCILIGENDTGKSTLLKALDLLLSKGMPSEDDFFKLNAEELSEFKIGGVFTIEDGDDPNILRAYISDGRFHIRKIFRRGEAFKTEVLKNMLTDTRLETYLSLNAEAMKQLVEDLGLGAFARQEERQEAVRQYIDANWTTLPKTPEFTEVSFNTIAPVLPIYQYYGSHVYGDPQALVKRTLDTLYSAHFYDEGGALKVKSIVGLRDKVLAQLNKSVQEQLLARVAFYNPKVTGIQGRLDIDFTRGLDFQGLELNEGGGYKLVSQKGEGSKKRLFLSILEWDKEVQKGITAGRAIIRGYDEPDSNLHFDAQRKMFNAIAQVAGDGNNKVQAIVATHSITMIDRAPADSIVHVIQDEGLSSVEYLKTDGDQDIADFLNEISVAGGIRNSSIFYERCFLLVEGESEESAIPKIYRKLFGRTLVEDGIVLINLHSNGAWFNFLKLMRSNKERSTVMLLDTDTQNADCGASVTVARLNEIGFSASFMQDHVFFAGAQEFEDIFPDSRIREVLNKLYPRPTKTHWTLSHVRRMRKNHPKLSKGLAQETMRFISHHHRRYRKPEFADALVESLSAKELKTIPILLNLFKKAHSIAE
jgi:energy-coupling factor transporter ATP-binding protein EcfA2